MPLSMERMILSIEIDKCRDQTNGNLLAARKLFCRLGRPFDSHERSRPPLANFREFPSAGLRCVV
jgi:hypothetical protein